MMLIIVSGLPGSGKTTFARALAQRLGARHLNSDMIREELGKRGAYDPDTKALIYRNMRERAQKYLQAGETLVVDATFHNSQYREPYLQLAERSHLRLKWIELEANEATIRERVSKKRDYSEADFSVYQKIKSAYEPVPVPHLVLPSDRWSMDEMLEKAIDYLE